MGSRRRSPLAPALVASGLFLLLTACGGGGSSSGGGGGGGGVIPTPAPTPVPSPATATQSFAVGPAAAQAPFGPLASGASGTFTFPATQAGTATGTVTEQSTLPTGAPVPARALSVSAKKRIETLGGTVTPLLYLTVSMSATVTIASTPAFSLTFPAGTLAGDVYAVVYNPSSPLTGWNVVSGPQPGTGTTVTFPSATLAPPLIFAANTSYIFAIVETGTPLPTPTPSPSPTPIPTSSPVAGMPTPGATLPPSGHNNSSGWGPTAAASAFKYPVQSGYNGNGVTVAIIGTTAPLASDLAAYNAGFGLTYTGNYSVKVINGGPAAPDPAGQGEATLDVETVEGLAPGANVVFYSVPDTSGTSFDAGYNTIISDHAAAGTPYVVSISYGGCEVAGYTNTTQDTILANGASAGVTFVASAGDNGNECFTGGTPAFTVGVNAPASDPNVIGVGGTESVMNGSFNIANPVAWNDNLCASGQCATGGGVSTLFSIPTYQSGVAGIASATMRNVPDIALPAVQTAVYSNGAWATMAGTSWSAPQAAALVAEIDEYCHLSSVANPVTIFYTAETKSTANFIDVTSGNNQFGTTTPFYTATAGYDNTSGFGFPLGMNVAQSLCPNNIPLIAHASSAYRPLAETLGAPGPRVLPMVPPVRGLRDLGPRLRTDRVTTFIVLRDTPSLLRDESTVIASLQHAGFTIDMTYGNHLAILASAPTSIINAYFATTMHDVVQGRYGTRYLPMTSVTLPAEIAPFVSGVTLDNIIRMAPISASHVPTH